MGYLHYFKTQSQFNAAYNGTGYTEPWVSCVYEQKRSDYNKSKLWDGVSSVLDLRDIENNPNIELKSQDWAYPEYSWPDAWPYYITDYSTASTQDKYACYHFKNFVLPGLTGSTPIIKTILTDWEEAWGQTGNTGTMVLRGEAYDWGASGYDYGVYWIEIGEYGGIQPHVYD